MALQLSTQHVYNSSKWSVVWKRSLLVEGSADEGCNKGCVVIVHNMICIKHKRAPRLAPLTPRLILDSRAVASNRIPSLANPRLNSGITPLASMILELGMSQLVRNSETPLPVCRIRTRSSFIMGRVHVLVCIWKFIKFIITHHHKSISSEEELEEDKHQLRGRNRNWRAGL